MIGPLKFYEKIKKKIQNGFMSSYISIFNVIIII